MAVHSPVNTGPRVRRPLTFVEIGDRLGIAPQTVSRIHQRAMAKLRRELERAEPEAVNDFLPPDR